ncbi:MAG: NUDIX domain-containing protein [Bacteroidales bacterium]|nr:NUDIX domain-containing protein [Bacteroidales bacterium]
MYRIFFESREIVIFNPATELVEREASDCLYSGPANSLPDAVADFEQDISVNRLLVPTPTPEMMLETIAGQYCLVDAAGGYVQSPDGAVLMIHHRDVWDLPKGMVEPGEDKLSAALREVKEETGVEAVSDGVLICITYHTYRYEGKKMLKRTFWYRMTAVVGETKPQTEEEISEALWIDKKNMPHYINATYPSIKQVISLS